MVEVTAMDVFTPEDIKIMFKQIKMPQTLYGRLFGEPKAMGLYSFGMGTMDDPYAMLPEVGDVEDAKEMMTSMDIEHYVLKNYRGYVDIPNKLINQWAGAGKLPEAMENVRETYIRVLRQGVENTNEYVCFNAMDEKRSILSTSHDWTEDETTVDNIIADLAKARKAYIDATKVKPTVAIHNPEATLDITLRKDFSNKFYFPNGNTLESGDLGRLLGMSHSEQVGGYKDYEGETLEMFTPTTTGKNLTYVLDPATFGYPVTFGSPKFSMEEINMKDCVRVIANYHAGFVYLDDDISAITV
jgi:hypothetical protein